jgi:hypothetical protein
MSVRLYKLIWLIFLGIAALTFISGNLTAIVGVVFGHIVFGLIFMGMMVVLPTSITHPSPAVSGPGSFARARTAFRRLSGRVNESGSTWIPSNNVEVRHPKYH